MPVDVPNEAEERQLLGFTKRAISLVEGGLSPDAAIENRMLVSRSRLGLFLFVRSRESAGVGELQADEQVAVGRRSEMLAMRVDE